MKYYNVEDVQNLIAACEWRMTLAKERGGEGFVEYDKTIIDVNEFQKRLSTLEVVEADENTISRDGVIKELRLEYPSMPFLPKKWQDEWLLKTEGYRKAEEIIKNASGVIPQKEEGEWIEHKEKTIVKNGNFVDFFPTEYECSNCGLRQATYFINSSLPNYCPNCGSKMKGAEE